MKNYITFSESSSARLHSSYNLANVKNMHADEKADQLINKMVVSLTPLAAMPIFISLPLLMKAICTEVQEVGNCYGNQLSDEEAAQLLKQFIDAAGIGLVGLFVSTQILSMAFALTGAGYVVSIALSLSASTSLAYIAGSCAKAYFKGERNKKTLGAIARSHLNLKRIVKIA